MASPSRRPVGSLWVQAHGLDDHGGHRDGAFSDSDRKPVWGFEAFFWESPPMQGSSGADD